jgi:hypothetical protein
MKKKLLLIIGITLVFLFAGCTSESGGKNNRFELDSFNGGDEALTMEFAEQSPPDKVRDQSLQPFSIRVLVENQGEYDIEEGTGYVKLTGFNPEDLNIEQTSKPLNTLRGFKKQGSNTIPGGKQQVVFDNLKYTNSVVSGSYPFKFYANLCYPYQTKAFALICINGNTVPAIDKKTEICELEGKKEYANSGAPVKIENVQQYPYGEHSIQIQFDIVHTPTSDQANIYESGSIDSQCNIDGISPSSSDALFKKDKVTYTLESDISGLDCESTGTNTNTITLNSNKYTVTCVQDTTGQEEYEKPITIILDYDYLDRKSKTIQIEHVQR